MERETVTFEGRVYARGGKFKYFRCTGRFLHRSVWEAVNGAIPKGWQVHHKNGDRGDNRIENLECVPPDEHRKLHADKTMAYATSPEQRAHLERIRELSKAWHASPEGREWHRANAISIRERGLMGVAYSKAPFFDRACSVCGTLFNTNNKQRVFCSSACACTDGRQRKRAAKLDVAHNCKECGGVFYTVQTRKVFCSAKCRGAHGRAVRGAARVQSDG